MRIGEIKMGTISDEDLIEQAEIEEVEEEEQEEDTTEEDEEVVEDDTDDEEISDDDVEDDSDDDDDTDTDDTDDTDVDDTDDTDTDKDVQDKEEIDPEQVKHIVKVDGEEVEATLADLKKGFSKAAFADNTMREATALKKQNEALVKMIQDDTEEVLDQLGVDKVKLAEKVLAEAIRVDNMSEEEKKGWEAQQKLKDLERKREIEQQKQAEIRAKQLVQEYSEALTEIGLPVDQVTVASMDSYMTEVLNSDDPDVKKMTVKDIAPLVLEDYKKALSKMTPEQRMNLLGEDLLVKDKTKKKPKKKKAKKPTRPTKSVKGKTPTKKKTLTTEEFNAYLDSLS